MNTADYIRMQFDWLYWASDQVLRAASGMTEEEYARPNGFNYKNIRGILTHALGSEVAWFKRAQGLPLPEADSAEAVNETNLATVEALTGRWQLAEQEIRAFLDKMTEADLDNEVVYAGREGVERRQPLWQICALVYQHTLQHRSEAAEALTMIGRSPGGLDLPSYLAER